MKIRSIHTHEAGPLGTQTIDLTDDWSGSVAERVLFSGPNGCGKSNLLRVVAYLWDAVGYWLDNQKALPRPHEARTWLQQWGGVALVLQDVPGAARPIGVGFGDVAWLQALSASSGDVAWFWEQVERTGKVGAPRRTLVLPREDWVRQWAAARRKLVLTTEKGETPNMLYLDAEERRWVRPKKGVGELAPDDLKARWLVTYRVSEQWAGQLEASLVNLKTVRLHKFHEVIRDLNAFLAGKEIDPDIREGENRLRVKLHDRRGARHGLDEFSAGEHQVLILVYLLSRWLEPGGVALIDEPDLHLHPSLISGLLARAEALVTERGGQLLITSHVPDVWSRYESTGKRIRLGGEL